MQVLVEVSFRRSQLKKWAKTSLMWPQEFLHVREENYQSTSITEVDKSCRCPLSPVATFSIADPAFTEANKVLEHL